MLVWLSFSRHYVNVAAAVDIVAIITSQVVLRTLISLDQRRIEQITEIKRSNAHTNRTQDCKCDVVINIS